MICVLSSSVVAMLLRPFLETRFSISTLPSVVSDGSPGSLVSDPFAVDERNLFAGGLDASIELPFLCFKVGSAADSPSSPEASRDDGCNCTAGMVFVLFRFPEPADEGEDIMVKEGRKEGERRCLRKRICKDDLVLGKRDSTCLRLRDLCCCV